MHLHTFYQSLFVVMMLLNRVLLCFFLIGLSLLGHNALAQHQDTIRTKYEPVVEVETSADASAKTALKKPIKLVQAQSVAEGLLLHPGLQLRDYGGFGGIKTVSFRGLGAEHSQILLNGFQIGGNSVGMADLSTLPALVEPELTTSCQAVTNSSATELNAGGVVLISANLKADSTYLDLVGGSMGYWSGAFNLKRSIKTPTMVGHMLLALKSEQASGVFDYNISNGDEQTKSQRSNAGFKNHSLLSYSTLTSRSGTTIKGQLMVNHSDRELPGAIILYNPHSAQNLFNTRISAGLALEKPLTKDLILDLKSGYQLDHTRYQDPYFLNNTGGLDNRYFWHEGTLKSALGYHRGSFKVRVLTDLTVQRLEDGITLPSSKPHRAMVNPGLDAGYRLSVSVEIKAAGTLWLVQENASIPQIHRPSAIVQLSWSHDIGLTKIGLTPYARQFMRLPTMAELYYGQSVSRDLKPELVDLAGINLNVRSAIKQLKTTINLDVNGYWQKHQNKIVAIPTRNLFVWSIVNVGLAQGYGFEAQLNTVSRLGAATQIGLDASLTVQQLHDITNAELPSYGGQLPYLPVLSSAGQISFRHKQLGLYWQVFFNGERFTLAENLASNRLPAFMTHDFKTSFTLGTSNNCLNRLQVQASVRNVFDQQYQVILSFPMPGRYYMAGISYAI